MNLIGLGGKLRSGKDAISDHFVANHGFVKLGMSDALHEAMLAIDPVVRIWNDGTFERYGEVIEAVGYVEAKAQYPEVRRLLQALGTEVGRDMIGENTWADIMRRKIDALQARGASVVVTGIRFRNEIDMIAELDGWSVWVERPGVSAPTSGTAAHASENSVTHADFDTVIENDGTLEQLYAQVDAFLAEEWVA